MTRQQTSTGIKGKRTFKTYRPVSPVQEATITEIDLNDEPLKDNENQQQARPLPVEPDLTTSTAGTSHNKPQTPHTSTPQPSTTRNSFPPSTNTAADSSQNHHHYKYSSSNPPNSYYATADPTSVHRVAKKRRYFAYRVEHERYLAQLFTEPNAWEILSGSMIGNACYTDKEAVFKSIAKRFNDRFSLVGLNSITESQMKNKLKSMQSCWRHACLIIDTIEKGVNPLCAYRTKEEGIMTICHYFFLVDDLWTEPQNLRKAGRPVFTMAEDGSSVLTVNGATIFKLDKWGKRVEEKTGKEEEEERTKEDWEEEMKGPERGERDEEEEQKEEEEEEENHSDGCDGIGSDDRPGAPAGGDSTTTLNELVTIGGVSNDELEAPTARGTSSMNKPIESGGAFDLGDDPLNWDDQHTSSTTTNQKKRSGVPDHGSTKLENLVEQTREGLYLKRRKLELEETTQAEQRELIRMQRQLLRLQIVKLEREMEDEENRRKIKKLQLEVERKKIQVENSQLDRILAQGQGGKQKDEIKVDLNVEATIHICPAPSSHHPHPPHHASKLTQ